MQGSWRWRSGRQWEPECRSAGLSACSSLIKGRPPESESRGAGLSASLPEVSLSFLVVSLPDRGRRAAVFRLASCMQKDLLPSGRCAGGSTGERPARAGDFSKLFPRKQGFQRTRGVPVRMTHASRGVASRPEPRRRLFLKAERIRKAASWKTSGVLRGDARGRRRGRRPIARPPCPVWKTHLQTRKIDFRQARREPVRSDPNAAPTPPPLRQTR